MRKPAPRSSFFFLLTAAGTFGGALVGVFFAAGAFAAGDFFAGAFAAAGVVLGGILTITARMLKSKHQARLTTSNGLPDVSAANGRDQDGWSTCATLPLSFVPQHDITRGAVPRKVKIKNTADPVHG
jgi:hypothetical protein